MTRLTKEREAEIRNIKEEHAPSGYACELYAAVYDLLFEIDALRAERDQLRVKIKGEEK